MKKIIFSFLILVICSMCIAAQTITKDDGLPTNLGELDNADSYWLLNDSVVKKRLEKLLGKTNYAAFLESFETVAPIVKKGSFFFSSGCLIHACTHLESAVAVDSVKKTLHAAIYRRNEKTKYFNEDGRKTPRIMRTWANRLSAID